MRVVTSQGCCHSLALERASAGADRALHGNASRGCTVRADAAGVAAPAAVAGRLAAARLQFGVAAVGRGPLCKLQATKGKGQFEKA